MVVVATSCGSESTSSGVDATTTVVETTTTTTAPTTTTEPVVEEETLPAPDADMITLTEAFGLRDADLAWSFYSARCQSAFPEALSFPDIVADYAANFPGATAVNISAVVDGDTAAISLDVRDGNGEFVESYLSQPWIFSDGKWYRDAC